MRLNWVKLCTAFSLFTTACVMHAPPVGAQQPQVDLALVLAVDISASVDDGEAGIQREGYVAALRDPRVVEAIRSGVTGRIALTYVERSGPTDQNQLIMWREISDAASAQAFADELQKAPYTPGYTTSISGGIDFCVQLLHTSGINAARRVIDVSGDGYSDRGRDIRSSRDDAVKQGIVINGLPLMNPRPAYRAAIPSDLDTYYAKNVTGGRGSFTLVVRKLEDFNRLVLRKLLLEIAENHATALINKPS